MVQNRIKRAVAKTMLSLENRVYPPGAISFYQYVGVNPARARDYAVEVGAIRSKFGFSRLFILHGVLFKTLGGKNVAVLGPTAIGKSASLRKMAASSTGKPLEDSYVLVGEKKGRFFAITSGTASLKLKISAATNLLSNVTFQGHPYVKESKPRGMARAILDRIIANFARGSVSAAYPRNRTRHVPELEELHRLLLFEHPNFRENHALEIGREPVGLGAGGVKELFHGSGVVVSAAKSDEFSRKEIIELILKEARR